MRHKLYAVFVMLLLIAAARSAGAGVVTCDPTTALQTCVSNATASGSTAGTVILVPSGTSSVFSVSSLIDLPSNITIRCEPNVMIQQTGGNPIFRAQYQQNIVIEGCTFDGQSAKVYGLVMFNVSHVRLSRNTFQHFGDNAVTSFPGGDWTDVEIERNVFTAAGLYDDNSAAVQLLAQSGASGSSNVRVHHNTCNNAAQYTGCFKFAAQSSVPLTQLSVTDNVVNFASSSHGSLGIELFSTDNTDLSFVQFTIANNIIQAAWGSSSQAFGISAYGSRGVIAGNTLNNCFGPGIEVLGSYISVVGNTLTYSGPVIWNAGGASRSGVVIADNTTFKSYGAAIQIYAHDAGQINDGIIANNIVQTPDHGDGILVQTASSGSLRDIHIDNNLLELPNGGYAVHTEGNPSQVQIDNNRLVNISGTGFFLNGAGQAFTVRFNDFSGSGSWEYVNPSTTITRSVENIVNGTCCH